MPTFDDHDYVISQVELAQEAEHDMREQVRESQLFVYKRNGQWEQDWWDRSSGKPRYTFDMTSPVVQQIHGSMKQSDFTIDVAPAGGDATKDLAKTYNGMIRNIENISNAGQIYQAANKNMVIGGLDGWRVVQAFADDNSFHQDLLVKKISNYVDRVWHDPGAEMQDRSDVKWAVVISGMTKRDYKEQFPKGTMKSMPMDRDTDDYWHKPDLIFIADFYYIKPENRDLVLMSNGAVYEDNEDFRRVKDELAAQGIQEQERRTQKKNVVWIRQMDGGGWLGEAQRQVFNYIPVIPLYGNFNIIDNKSVYHGAVEKLMDPQRVGNYSMSREIEEGALAPRAKFWMTIKQALGFRNSLATLNTNTDPVQFYNHDKDTPGPPQQQGGARINEGLRVISEKMQNLIMSVSGMFAASQGETASFAQSGVAIDKLQERGDIGTIDYFESAEIAIQHTCKILVNAIPEIYDVQRTVRVLNEDGSFEMVPINQPTLDTQTLQMVTLNDLSQGQYDVTCKAGPSFRNRQQETISAMMEIGQIYPDLIPMAADVLLNSSDAPGMDLIAERAREELFKLGRIPASQMNDEEKQKAIQKALQEQQQGQQPDAATILAQAEMGKAQASLITAQNKQTQSQIDLQEAGIELQQKQQKIDQDAQATQIKLGQEQQKIEQRQGEIDFNQLMAQQSQMAEMLIKNQEFIKLQADTLEKIRTAAGVDTIIGPSNQAAYIEQSRQLALNLGDQA